MLPSPPPLPGHPIPAAPNSNKAPGFRVRGWNPGLVQQPDIEGGTQQGGSYRGGPPNLPERPSDSQTPERRVYVPCSEEARETGSA